MRRLVVMLACAVVLSACAHEAPAVNPSPGGRGSIDDITVGTSDTFAPTLEYSTDLVYDREQTVVMWSGDGEALAPGQVILLHMYAESMDNGQVLANTFDGLGEPVRAVPCVRDTRMTRTLDGLPEPYLLAPEFLGESLYNVLSRQRVGTRVLHVAPENVEEGCPAMALIIDIMPLRADGHDIGHVEGLPTVLRDGRGEPTVVIADDLVPPVETTAVALIQGGGTQVRPGSSVLVHYKAVEWDSGQVFLDTWALATAPFATVIGEGFNIAGWEEGLMDHTAGSQVLLVVPPDQGYPDRGTTVYVVDILHVWNAGA